MGNVLVKWVPETFMKDYSEQEKDIFGKDLTDYEKEVKILEKIASGLEKEKK